MELLIGVGVFFVVLGTIASLIVRNQIKGMKNKMSHSQK